MDKIFKFYRESGYMTSQVNIDVSKIKLRLSFHDNKRTNKIGIGLCVENIKGIYLIPIL